MWCIFLTSYSATHGAKSSSSFRLELCCVRQFHSDYVRIASVKWTEDGKKNLWSSCLWKEQSQTINKEPSLHRWMTYLELWNAHECYSIGMKIKAAGDGQLGMAQILSPGAWRVVVCDHPLLFQCCFYPSWRKNVLSAQELNIWRVQFCSAAVFICFWRDKKCDENLLVSVFLGVRWGVEEDLIMIRRYRQRKIQIWQCLLDRQRRKTCPKQMVARCKFRNLQNLIPLLV